MTPDYSVSKLQPVNWAHPLNRGLVSWWLNMPGWTFGSTWRDLCGRNHGTLTSMDPATDWVSPRGRVGGLGALDFDATNDYVAVPNGSINFLNGGQWSISVWYNLRTNASFPRVLAQAIDGYNTFSFVVFTGGYPSVSTVIGGVTTTVDYAQLNLQNAWVHLLAVIDSTPSAMYRNGIALSTATSGSSNTHASNVGITIGARTDASRFWDGWLDDIRIWNRKLTEPEAWALYNDSRQGYPGTLNRVRRSTASRRYVAGGGGGGGTGDPMLLFT